MAPENLFAGAYLDRRAEARLHDDWIGEARSDPETLYVAMRGGAALTRAPGEGGHTRIAFLAGADMRVQAATPEQMVLFAAIFGALAVALGLFLSVSLDTPGGPSIVLMLALFFAAAMFPTVVRGRS